MSSDTQNAISIFKRDVLRGVRLIDAFERFYLKSVDSGTFLAIILGFALITRVLWIWFTDDLAITGAMEESLLQLVSARNWLERGFWTTIFLPDYVTSVSNQHHPVIYTHFPPVSALIPALFLKFGASLKVIRLFFSIINVLGIYFFYRFLKAAFDKHTAIAGTFFATLLYEQLFIWHDHFDYSFTFLVFFLPCSLIFSKNNARLYLGVAISVFFASILNYKIMFTQVAMIAVVSLYHEHKRTPYVVALCIVAAVSGVALHLLQNFGYLGLDIGLQELVSTFRNRVFGYPSTADLQEWFRAHNIVLWGAPKELKTGDFLKPVLAPVEGQYAMMRGLFRWPLALIMLLGARYFGESIGRKKIMLLGGLIVVASAWGIAFPAHAQGYGISATEAVGPLVFIAYLFGFAFQSLPRFPRELHALAFVGIVILAVNAQDPFIKQFYKGLVDEDRQMTYDHLSELKRFRGPVTWTNVTSVWAGYFMDQIVPGRCTMAAVENVDLSQCMNVMVNSRADIAQFSKPRYFIYSDKLLSGNMADATPEKLAKFKKMLDRNLRWVDENNVYTVYEFKEGVLK